MANYRVKSGATGLGNGSTWADAYTAVEAGAEAVSGPGNTLLVSSTHTETFNAATTWALGGTVATGEFRMLSVSDATENPTAITAATAPQITMTGANSLTVTGTGLIQGIYFKLGNGASASSLLVHGASDNQVQVYRGCTIEFGSTSSTAAVRLGTSGGEQNQADFYDCWFKFGSTGQMFYSTGTGVYNVYGGGILAGSSAITTLFKPNGTTPVAMRFIGFDASNAATGVTLVTNLSGFNDTVEFINCKFPTGWSGTLVNADSVIPSFKVVVSMCKAGSTLYRYWSHDYAGEVQDTTSVYVTAGQDDDITRYSYAFTTHTTANDASRLIGPNLHGWVSTGGVAHTAKVEIAYDGATSHTDADIALELFVDNQWVGGLNANPLSAGTTLSNGDEAWTGATGTGPNGSTTWNLQKLSVSFTPSAAGPVLGRVVFKSPSETIYVDTNLTITAN